MSLPLWHDHPPFVNDITDLLKEETPVINMSQNHWVRKPTGYEQTNIGQAHFQSTKTNSYNQEYVRYGTFSRAGWGLEIVSSFSSFFLLACIIAIFRYMEDQPLSKWQFPMSLNAVIAILTTACTAAMMQNVSACISQQKWLHFKMGPRQLYNIERFDEASRGPYGSLIFLLKVRWSWATVGALITIFRLAFAPLTQQVVNLTSQEITISDSNATFGYTHQYARYFGPSLVNYQISSVPQDPSMQSAILQGLYDISSPPQFTCSGFCVWEESYISLGFKSTCKNVTMSTLAKQSCSTAPDNSKWDCNMTTPGGILLSSHFAATNWGTTLCFNASSTMGNSFNDLPPEFPTIAKLAVYRSTLDTEFEPHNINITECALSLTAYEYSGAKANGSSFEFGSVKEVTLGHDAWMGNSGDLDGLIWTNESKAEGLPQLKISWPDLKGIQIFLESSTLVAEWVDGNWDNRNPGISAALIGNVDLPKRFDKMASSMTDYLRSGINHQIARGLRVELETFVSIRWPWAIGPIVIELAAIFFAIFSMTSNAEKYRVPLWKSSALALLECKHEEATGLIVSKIKDIKFLEKVAREYETKLE